MTDYDTLEARTRERAKLSHTLADKSVERDWAAAADAVRDLRAELAKWRQIAADRSADSQELWGAGLEAERVSLRTQLATAQANLSRVQDHLSHMAGELAERETRIAEARSINAEPAHTLEDARQKSDRLDVLLSRVPQGATEAEVQS